MEDAYRRRLAAWVLSIASLLASAPASAAPPVFKCMVDGAVTYQHTPCAPAGERAASPTAQQLNAERQKKLRQAASAASASAPAMPEQRAAKPGQASTPAVVAFKCDGRTQCSQMTSCAEAKYFLAHCPGVQMDGDRNGIPCERQWCNR